MFLYWCGKSWDFIHVTASLGRLLILEIHILYWLIISWDWFPLLARNINLDLLFLYWLGTFKLRLLSCLSRNLVPEILFLPGYEFLVLKCSLPGFIILSGKVIQVIIWLLIRLHAWRLLHQPHTLQKSIKIQYFLGFWSYVGGWCTVTPIYSHILV